MLLYLQGRFPYKLGDSFSRFDFKCLLPLGLLFENYFLREIRFINAKVVLDIEAEHHGCPIDVSYFNFKMFHQTIYETPHGLLDFTKIKRLVRLRKTWLEINEVSPCNLRFNDVGIIEAEVSKTCLHDCITFIEFCVKLEVFWLKNGVMLRNQFRKCLDLIAIDFWQISDEIQRHVKTRYL